MTLGLGELPPAEFPVELVRVARDEQPAPETGEVRMRVDAFHEETAEAPPALLLALYVAGEAPAQETGAREGEAAGVSAETEDAAAWARLRSTFDPSADDPRQLAALAGAASAAGDLSRFHLFLDSLVAVDAAGPHALRTWGAVGLQLGVEPDSVARRFTSPQAIG